MTEKKYEQEIEVKGHLIDSMILTRIFDNIMDLNGDFQVLDFNVGKRKKDVSYARLIVRGKSREHLNELLESLYREGAQPISIQQAMLRPVIKDMVMPDNFYSTTETRGGRIIVVAGPVLVHSGASEALAKLIQMGYVHGLLTGNALAVHDVENALMGTSLGMRIKDGTLAIRGHRNHMQAINEVFKAGSLKAMVRKGILKSGVMYECIVNDIPFVLAGSVRDDGPIPDVITDIVEAQRKYKQVLEGAKMVLMLSTMLHSIAVGNMLPSSVKVVALDISQPVVTKLIDRGTMQAIGIVTDVGAFLPTVVQYLEKIEKSITHKKKVAIK